jgi:hypothetical protein
VSRQKIKDEDFYTEEDFEKIDKSEEKERKAVSEVKTFDHLIGTEIRGKIVDDDILQKAINKCVADKRNSRRKDFIGEVSDALIIQECVEEDDVIRAISSIINLKVKLPDTSVKFDDVRNMSLGLDNLEGYTEAEKCFVQQRLSELSQDFNLEKSTDKFLAFRVVICELKIMQFETLTVMNKKEAKEIDAAKQIDALDKQYKVYCESLNVLKRQRDNTKEKPKDTNIDLTTAINQLDKSVNDMQLEVEFEKQQEIEMIRKLSKKDKKNVKEDD